MSSIAATVKVNTALAVLVAIIEHTEEIQRFMELQITDDKFHQCNHTSCGDSFKSSVYASLNGNNMQRNRI